MSKQFVGYHVDDYREDGMPISTGATRAEAQAQAIRRILSLGITWGGIAVRRNDSLTPEQFATLDATLNDWFRSKAPNA